MTTSPETFSLPVSQLSNYRLQRTVMRHHVRAAAEPERWSLPNVCLLAPAIIAGTTN